MKKKWIIITIGCLIGALLIFVITRFQTSPDLVKLPVGELESINEYQYQSPTYLSLWQDEAASETLQPKNLDSIKTENNQQTYTNSQLRYSITVPPDWHIDHHQPTRYTRFFGEDFRIDVTYEDTSKIFSTPDKFLNTTLTPIKDYETKRESLKQGDFNVLVVDYKRPAISGIKNDLTAYTYLFAYNNTEVYTFQLKTSETDWNNKRTALLDVFKSFKPVPFNEIDLNKDIRSQNIRNGINASYRHYSINIPDNAFVQGIYLKNESDLPKLEEDTNTRFGSQMIYKSLESEFDPYIVQILEEGRTPIVSFLFETPDTKGTSPILSEIINGDYDQHFISWATNSKRVGGPIYFRLASEMNGEWTVWNAIHNYNDPDLYKLAFRHIVDIFRHYEANNAKFVWNPSFAYAPVANWNHAVLYYPSDSYVDFVGLTGYNFGETEWTNWKTFDQIFDVYYYDSLRYYGKKPFIIGEYASVENGGNKAEWIQTALKQIPEKYPNILIGIWYNEKMGEDFNFPITSSDKATEAFSKSKDNANITSHPVTKTTKDQIIKRVEPEAKEDKPK